MVKGKKRVRSFTVNVPAERSQLGISVFNVIKHENALSVADIAERAAMPGERVAELINACVKKDLLKISDGAKGGLVKFNDKCGQLLGIGFSGKECILTIMDTAGNVLGKDTIEISAFCNWKGKNKEIHTVVDEIKKRAKYKGQTFMCAGLAVPEEFIDTNQSSPEMIAEGMRDVFGCDVFVGRRSTAAGYGEKDASTGARGKDVLYLYSDVGMGVVIKKEMIFEASQKGEEKSTSYLKPWDQFGIVRTAKDLVNKGLGTDMVNMVSGNIDQITLEVVLDAAEKNDELADDLVKRAGLALGVRAAYLVNIFGTPHVILGGGIEKKNGGFIKHVKESAERFLLKELRNKVEMIPGVLGKEAASTGAASLCRRELFMEV